jgi:hypothetical protein
MKIRGNWLCIHGYDSFNTSYMGKKEQEGTSLRAAVCNMAALHHGFCGIKFSAHIHSSFVRF